jgi:hypothetical protein
MRMSSVIEKKKKSWFAKIFDKRESNPSPSELDGVGFDLLGDVRTDDDEAAAIEARRDELRAARHGNSNATVTFNGND